MSIKYVFVCLLFLLLAPAASAQNPVEYIEISRIGRGAINGLYMLGDGQTIAVTTVRGIWLYQAENPHAPPRWIDRDSYTVLQSTDGGEGTQAPLPYSVYSPPEIAFDPRGETVAIADHTGGIRLLDVRTGEQRAALHNEGDAYETLAFSPDGATLAAARSVFRPLSVAVDLWNIRDGSLRETLTIPSFFAPGVLLFSPNGDYLVVGIAEVGGDYERYGTAILDLATGETVLSLTHGRDLPSRLPRLELPPLVINDANYPLGFGDPSAAFTIQREADLPPSPTPTDETDETAQVYQAVLDAHRLVIPELESLTNATPLTLEDHQLTSPDGLWLLTTDRPDYQPPQLIHLSDSLTLPLALPDIARNSTVLAACFSDDGRWLALAFGSSALGGTYDNVVRIWDISNDQPDAQPAAALEHRDTLTTIAFSPDSALLATAAEDKAAYVWDTADWTLRAVLLHPADVQHLTFSDDSVILTTYAEDGLLRLWRAAS
jgi:WD40 repeat protein